MELQAATAAPAAPALSPVSSMEMQQAASLKLEGISRRGTAATAIFPLALVPTTAAAVFPLTFRITTFSLCSN